VANTSEVGPIRVTGYESKGRINKRIRIELGKGWRAAGREA
jgi:Ser-tRNA(Ala) deacylase AlaX